MERHTIPDMDIRATLAKRGLECHLLMEAPNSPIDTLQSFRSALHAELKPTLEAAYERELKSAHLLHETWAVTLRQTEAPHQVVACATLQFISNYPCCFHTHFEAVHPENQGVGLGRLLYDCIAAWTRFLALNDPLVLHMILRSNNEYFLVSTIDRDDGLDNDEEEEVTDNDDGHGIFLKKLGFSRAQHDFGQNIDCEIAFQRPFAIPRSLPDPVECTGCNMCLPACPVGAIFIDGGSPAAPAAWTEINALWFSDPAAARARVDQLGG